MSITNSIKPLNKVFPPKFFLQSKDRKKYQGRGRCHITAYTLRNLLYPLDTFLVMGSLPLIKGNGKTLGGYISKTKLVRRKYLKELEERNTYGF